MNETCAECSFYSTWSKWSGPGSSRRCCRNYCTKSLFVGKKSFVRSFAIQSVVLKHTHSHSSLKRSLPERRYSLIKLLYFSCDFVLLWEMQTCLVFLCSYFHTSYLINAINPRSKAEPDTSTLSLDFSFRLDGTHSGDKYASKSIFIENKYEFSTIIFSSPPV